MFEPLQPRESAVDTCARAIRHAIMTGELSPGERLPPERRLAEQFEVNRVTVRGALAQLAHSQLLSVRQGSGYVVRDYRRRGGPELIAGLAELATGQQLRTIARDLLFVRRHLARAVLVRLAELPAVETAPITIAVDAFADTVASLPGGPGSRGAEALALADLAIVEALVDATGSAVLQLSMNPLQHVLFAMPTLRNAIYQAPEGNVDGWRALLAWLEERRPEMIDVIVAELARRDAATVDTLAEDSQ